MQSRIPNQVHWYNGYYVALSRLRREFNSLMDRHMADIREGWRPLCVIEGNLSIRSPKQAKVV